MVVPRGETILRPMTTSLPPADARFRSLVDGLGAIVWEGTVGPTPEAVRFTFVSEGTEALLGYPATRWTAEPGFWYDLIHPEDRAAVAAAMAEAARERRGADFEFRARAAGGRTLWLRNIVQTVPSENGGAPPAPPRRRRPPPRP